MSDRRSIFQEVSGSAPPRQAPAPRQAAGAAPRRAIRLWLLLLLAMVVAMTALGGWTRLTDSGLSITEWKPISGAIPPLSREAWQAEFDKYRQIPEYQLQNKGMSLDAFKRIFFWEWAHRLLGRAIGLVWAAGFLWFLARRQIPPGWTGRLLLPGILGAGQGALGWWMVSSGLTGRMVDVASYRLALHLGLAFVIMGVILWLILLLSRDAAELLQARRRREGGLARLAGRLLALALFQVLLGALVAGIDAGRGYTDWPLMNGAFLPPESFDYLPLWSNLFENPALVQFNHRIIGYLLFAFAGFTWWRSRRSPLRATRGAFGLLMAMVVLQMLLGIVTVLYAAPAGLAILHQLGAVAVVLLVLRARFLALYPPAQPLGAPR